MKTRGVVLQMVLVLAFLLFGALAVVGLASLRGSPTFDQEQAWRPMVEVQEMRSDAHARQLHSQGTLQPRQILPLRSTVRGIIPADTPRWSSGDVVAAGEMLLQIDAPDIDAALAQAQAELSRLAAEQDRLAAQITSDRALLAVEEELLRLSQGRLAEDQQAGAQGSLSTRQVEQQQQQTLQTQRSHLQRQQALAQAEPQRAVIAAQLQAAQARLEEAQRQQERLTLRAPFAGIIRQAPYAVGQMVNPGDVLLEISEAAAREVHFSVDQASWLSYLGAKPEHTWKKTQLRFRPAGSGEEHELGGSLLRQEAVVDAQLRLVQVVALIDEDQQNHLRLADGSFGAVRLLGPAQRGLRLPHPAVSNGRVWVVDADDVLQQRTVQGLRRLDADSWWLPSEDGGLDEGERVVLRPTADLVPGLRVIVQSAEAEDHSL